jgi:hypothetical protein
VIGIDRTQSEAGGYDESTLASINMVEKIN